MLEIFGDLEVTMDTCAFVSDASGNYIADGNGYFVTEYQLLKKINLPSTSTDEDIQRINDLYSNIQDKSNSTLYGQRLENLLITD